MLNLQMTVTACVEYPYCVDMFHYMFHHNKMKSKMTDIGCVDMFHHVFNDNDNIPETTVIGYTARANVSSHLSF